MPVDVTSTGREPAPRILQIAHSHPRFHPGGTELTALALHHEALASGIDSWYLGALDSSQMLPNPGTQMIALSADHREAALFTDGFHRFALSQQSNFGFLREFRDYLQRIRPDVVHLHHVLNFGLEAIYAVRAALPDARIILTLHDYYLLCANDGQLYKHPTRERCPGPTAGECRKCLPKRNANDFAMRALDIRHALGLCDRLVSPSFFLKRKFDDYLGAGPEIAVIENGYIGTDSGPATAPAGDGDGVTFGYFGNISAIKGLTELLDAADLLLKRGIENFSIDVHGSQLYEEKVIFDRMQAARQTLGDRIRFHGQYAAEKIGRHLENVDCVVFPSVWWENAPLVIYEALHHGRQVVSYPDGGAPEILTRYGAGVIATAYDPSALADAMAQVLDNRSCLKIALTRPLPARQQLLANYLACYLGQ